jgi:hypothetical protein
MFHGLDPTRFGAGTLVLAAASAAAFVALHAPTPDRDAARDALELLKAVASGNASAQRHVGHCVSAIAGAVRLEDQHGAAEDAVRGSWQQAAGRCTIMLRTLCGDAAAGAHEVCRRQRPDPG